MSILSRLFRRSTTDGAAPEPITTERRGVATGGRRRHLQRELVDSTHLIRSATPTEMSEIQSGSGWSGSQQGLPSGESVGELRPYLMRGLYPRPGYTEQMLRSDSAVYSGFERQLLTVSSLNWDIIQPAEPGYPATPEEIEQTRWVQSGWRRLESGFVGSAVVRPFTSRIHGFSLSEKVFAVDEETGLWRLDGMYWIPPWSVKAWVLDTSGHALGVMIRDDRGERVIWWESLHYQGQMFWGRNYEGLGILRPLKYVWDHKRQIMVDDAVARDRASAGIPYAEPPPLADPKSSGAEYDEAEEILRHILYAEDDDPPYYVAPSSGWKIGVNYLDGMPDNTGMLTYLDHHVASQMTDTLSQLGVSEHGARAVGAEQRLEKWSMLGGLCAIAAHNIDYSIHRQIYELNGWDTDRMCRTVASGLPQMDMYRRLFEFLTASVPENPLIETTDEMRQQIKRALGLRE